MSATSSFKNPINSLYLRLCLGSIFLIASFLPGLVSSHGRMMEPGSRSSLWRLPEYDAYHPEINYNDNELFCGGFELQHGHFGGKCGECGDAWNETKPRTNENGGVFGKGVTTRRYKQNETINILVELTFGHMGYFEFRICNLTGNSSLPETEACFEKNLLQLQLPDGTIGTRLPIPNAGAAWYKAVANLPPNLTCSHCVLQWHYKAGNSWGECDDGTWEVGCGPQETFRGCSDIAIEPY